LTPPLVGSNPATPVKIKVKNFFINNLQIL